MPKAKRTVGKAERHAILHALANKQWVYSERGLDELIDQHHSDYGQKVREKAIEVYNLRNK